MNSLKKIAFFIITIVTIQGCGIYNFSGGSVGAAKTFRVPLFQNYASQNPGSTIEPSTDRDFTIALQDLLLNQTSLAIVNSGGDLIYEGEIVEYRIAPMTATAQQTAAQNRLTIGVNVRFFNNTKDDVDFEKRFSFFYDYPASSQLASVKSEAHDAIFERLTQDIFNASLGDW